MFKLAVLAIIAFFVAVIPALMTGDGAVGFDRFAEGIGTTAAIGILACLGLLYKKNRDIGFAVASAIFTVLILYSSYSQNDNLKSSAAERSLAVEENALSACQDIYGSSDSSDDISRCVSGYRAAHAVDNGYEINNGPGRPSVFKDGFSDGRADWAWLEGRKAYYAERLPN